jgi:hypothetical protein
MSLTQRFQIEEIAAQNAAGVVYRGVDRVSGLDVAIRRLHGLGGEGASPPGFRAWLEERMAAAATVRHGGLRAVLAGGCDPVDGVPFVVNEWMEGRALDEWLGGRRLTATEARLLVETALEISALYEAAFGQPGMWLELDADSVVVVENGASGDLYFRLCRAAVLGGPAPTLAALGGFVEDLLGWKGRAFNDQSGDGLGRWLKWLGGRNSGMSSAEALAAWQQPELLDRAGAAERNTPDAGERAGTATRSAKPRSAEVPEFLKPGTAKAVVPFKKRSSGPRWAVAAVLVLGATGAWWALTGGDRQTEAGESPGLAEIAEAPDKTILGPATAGALADPAVAAAPPVTPPPANHPEAERIRRAQELAARLQEEARQRPALPPRVSGPRNEPVGVFQADQVMELMARRHREVVVEGVLVEVVPARAGQHLYFEFSPSGRPPYVTRGILRVASSNQMAERDRYLPWVGKQVRLRGKADVDRFREGDRHVARPKIALQRATDIELIE